MTDRYDSLSPRDLVTTIASLPRRFRGAFAEASRSEETLALVDAPGPSGESITTIANNAMRTVAILGSSAATLVRSNDPIVPAGALDTHSRSGKAGSNTSLNAVEKGLAEDCDALSELLSPLLGDEWNRTAKVTGGGTISLVDLIRELVRSSISLLNQAEDQAEWITKQAG